MLSIILPTSAPTMENGNYKPRSNQVSDWSFLMIMCNDVIARQKVHHVVTKE